MCSGVSGLSGQGLQRLFVKIVNFINYQKVLKLFEEAKYRVSDNSLKTNYVIKKLIIII